MCPASTLRVLVVSDDRRVARALVQQLAKRRQGWQLDGTTSWLLTLGLGVRGVLDAVVADAFHHTPEASLRALQELRLRVPGLRRLAVCSARLQQHPEVLRAHAQLPWDAGIDRIAQALDPAAGFESASAQRAAWGVTLGRLPPPLRLVPRAPSVG